MKLIHGDTVIVITGKDKGKKGTVMRVLREEDAVVVSGINMVTKHVRKTSESAGKIVRYEAPMAASKVMIVDPKIGKPSRIGSRIDPTTGKKVRFAKKSGTILAKIKIETKDAEAAAKIAQASASRKASKQAGTGQTQPGKADVGPAHAKPTFTRSAGRGS